MLGSSLVAIRTGVCKEKVVVVVAVIDIKVLKLFPQIVLYIMLPVHTSTPVVVK